MWLSIFLLGLAVNLEPTRICLVPLLLTRDRPRQQLIAFLAGSLAVNLGFGLLVLFALHHVPLGQANLSAGPIKIALGAIALVAAAVMALRWMRGRGAKVPVTAGPGTVQQPDQADRVTERFRKLLRKGRSPWFAALIGMGVGLPSPDYLGVLTIIATSPLGPAGQVATFVIFVVTGSLVTLVPLAGFAVAPDRTLALALRFGNWTRSRRQIEYAILLAAVGCLLIYFGIASGGPALANAERLPTVLEALVERQATRDVGVANRRAAVEAISRPGRPAFRLPLRTSASTTIRSRSSAKRPA